MFGSVIEIPPSLAIELATSRSKVAKADQSTQPIAFSETPLTRPPGEGEWLESEVQLQ